MKKLALALAGAAISLSAHSAIYSTWSETYNDPYAGTLTWDRHWDNTTHTLSQSSNPMQAAEWMADLPDNMFVAHVSIPGAHNYASGENNWASDPISISGNLSSATQGASTHEQLDRGIRGIDLRPGLHDDNTLYCYHGIARTTKTLEKAIDDMVFFLEKHPSEFFVVHLFRGNVYNSESESGTGRKVKDEHRATYNTELKRIFETKYGENGTAGHRVIAFKPNLTVKEARGKIVIFTRDRISFVHLDAQARITNWDTYFNPQNPAYITNELHPELTTTLHVQDISEGDDAVLDTKKEHFGSLFSFSQSQETPNNQMKINKGDNEKGYYQSSWVFNFTSIENSGSALPTDNTNGYRGGASVMNKLAVESLDKNLGRGPLGVFFSDYVLRTHADKQGASTTYTVFGDRLVYKIIENNFTGGDNAPVVRYAIDESQDWNALPPNPYAGHTYYLMNVGATETHEWKQYFGAGANYGAHCIVKRSGQPVSIDIDNATSRFKLRTNRGYVKRTNDGHYYCDGQPLGGSDYNTPTFEIRTGVYNGTQVYYFVDEAGNFLTAEKYTTDELGKFIDHPTYKVEPRSESIGAPRQMWILVPRENRKKETTDEAYATIESHEEIDVHDPSKKYTVYEEIASESHPKNITYMLLNPNFGNAQKVELSTDVTLADDNILADARWDKAWSIYKADENVVKGGRIERANGNYIRLYNIKERTGWPWDDGYWIGKGTKSNFDVTYTTPNLPAGVYKLSWQSMSYNQKLQVVVTDKSGAQYIKQTDGQYYCTPDCKETKDGHIHKYAPTVNGTPIVDADGKTKEENDHVAEWFALNPANGAKSIVFFVNEEGPVTIEFGRVDESHTSKTVFCLANLNLDFLGALDTKTTDSNNSNRFTVGTKPSAQTIEVNFPNHWNTLILPFDVAADDIPSNLIVRIATGHEDGSQTVAGTTYNYHVIKYSDPITTGISANTPYLIENTSAPMPPLYGTQAAAEARFAAPTAQSDTDTASHTYQFTGIPVNRHNHYFDGYLTGNIRGNALSEGLYSLVQTDYKQLFARNDDGTAHTANYRAFVHNHSSRSGATRSAIYFEEDDVLTGVETVATEAAEADAPVDVYTIGGMLVRSQVEKADALTDLPRGIYILHNAAGAVKVAK